MNQFMANKSGELAILGAKRELPRKGLPGRDMSFQVGCGTRGAWLEVKIRIFEEFGEFRMLSSHVAAD